MFIRSALAALSLVCATASAADLSILAVYGQPKNDDVVSDGIGAELQWRSWYTDTMAFAFAAGGIVHGANDDAYILPGDTFSGVQTDGNVTLLPVGPSLLLRAPSDGGVTTHLELGARYLLVDSGIDLARVRTGADGQTTSELDTLEFDNGIIGLGRVEFSTPIGATTAFAAGVGYQVDLVKGDLTYKGVKAGEAEWAGLFFTAGLHLTW